MIYSLASERSERDTLRSVQLRIADIYIIIIIYIQVKKKPFKINAKIEDVGLNGD